MVDVTKARVALVDDHPLFRQGLAAALEHEEDLVVVGEVRSVAEALELTSRVAIDIAVVEMLLPTTSGISLTSELRVRQPSCKVLGLSAVDDPCWIADMFRSHACGFASKTQEVSEILDAIRQVLGGLRYLPPRVSRDAVEAELAATPAHPIDRLTPREREVFALLIRGHSNDEVGIELHISRRTVETHRQRITRKLSAHSLAEMQRLAARYPGGGF